MMKVLYFVFTGLAVASLLVIPCSVFIRMIHRNLPNETAEIVELTLFYGSFACVSGLFFWLAHKVKGRMKHKKTLQEFDQFLGE